MTRKNATGDKEWHRFVLENGFRARVYDLAAAIGQDVDDVERIRRTGACTPLKKGKGFTELFSLWHGRLPEDDDWPAPLKNGKRGTYEWQEREVVLLASLVGSLGVADIAQILTDRLRKLTGDKKAFRNNNSIQLNINRIGMQAKDVVGGITTAAAGREIGSQAIINQAIHKKQLSATRVGRLWVISHESWAEWKAKRVFPPEGYVLLSSIKDVLSIRSDKLSEFARSGLIPSAIRCNPYGTKGPSTQFGTWYIDKKVADQLVSDRRAGRSMPWHGKPMSDNLRATFKLWKERKHPASCKICADIWGKQGAPKTFEEYTKRYPPLAYGEKRHMTRVFTPGLTIPEVAKYTGCSVGKVRLAIGDGMLAATLDGKRQYVSRTDATRWKARRCPTGENEKSWISIDTACKQYLFTRRELRGFVNSKKLKSKIGTAGPMRGVEYVSRHQCGQLREKIGFSEEQAALRVGVSVARFRILLEGVNWRNAEGIPLVTVQAVVKRLESRKGYTIEEAAEQVGETVQWVLERKRDGAIKVSRAKWDRRRTYITAPMLKRLQEYKRNPARPERLNKDWLLLSDAAHEAGVTAATIINWADRGELERRQSKSRWRYHREAVRARARIYWRKNRLHRAIQPNWLVAEKSSNSNLVYPSPSLPEDVRCAI